jgi:hypothetical protein
VAFRSPPTVGDWYENCYVDWAAPVDVQVEINGVAGTATSGRHYSSVIPARQWFLELHDAVPGDYVVTVTPGPAPVPWQIAPWQSLNTRLHLERGIGYALFSFWHGTQ